MVWSKIRNTSNSGLYIALLLLGLPLAIGVVFLLLWTQSSPEYHEVTQIQRWIEPLKTTEYNTHGFEKLAVDLPDFSKANWQTTTLPNSIPLTDSVDITATSPMARAWFMFDVKLPEDVGLIPNYAIYNTRIMGGAYAVWMNNELVHLNLKDWKMQWNYPVYVPIPTKLAKPNTTITVKVAIPYRLSQGYAIGSMYAGKAEPLSIERDIRNAVQVKFAQFSTGFMLIVGLMSFHLWLSRRQDTANLILAFSAIAFLVCNFQWFYEISNHEIASQWYSSLVDSSVMWVLILTYFYAMHIEKKHFPLFEKFLIFTTVGLTITTLPIWGYKEYALLFQIYFEIIFGLIINFILWRVSYKGASLEFKIITIAQTFMIILGVHDTIFLSTQSNPNHIYTFPYATLGIIFSFIFASQHQHIKALTEIEVLNNSLASKLAQRELELRIQHSKILEIEKSQTLLLERQRLVRDMHDGIGSSLMTTLAVAKQGQVTSEKMTEVLNECLDDLKNVIESLEPIEHDLTTLLGMLRQRLGKRIEQAGLKLIWQMDDIPQLSWLEPPHALQISRMIQEIFSNTLKHAKASEIRVSTMLTNMSGKSYACINISDNGQGFDGKSTVTGRGLKHLNTRASELGGHLEIDSKMNHGTDTRIYLPIYRA